MLIHAYKDISMNGLDCVRINMLMDVIKCVNIMWNYIKI